MAGCVVWWHSHFDRIIQSWYSIYHSKQKKNRIFSRFRCLIGFTYQQQSAKHFQFAAKINQLVALCITKTIPINFSFLIWLLLCKYQYTNYLHLSLFLFRGILFTFSHIISYNQYINSKKRLNKLYTCIFVDYRLLF